MIQRTLGWVWRWPATALGKMAKPRSVAKKIGRIIFLYSEEEIVGVTSGKKRVRLASSKASPIKAPPLEAKNAKMHLKPTCFSLKSGYVKAVKIAAARGRTARPK